MPRELTMDEMVEQYKTNFRGALQRLADRLEIPKSMVMEFDFDPVEEDGKTRLYVRRPSDNKGWVFEKDTGWQDLPVSVA
jgi:hypothetical protein